MGWFGRWSRHKDAGDIETTIGPSTTFTGELKVDGSLRIDGRFEGTLEVGGNVVVGEHGRVAADIDAGHVTIGGAVHGNIRATGRLEILSTGQVHGDILASQVLIDPGGVLQGMSLMGEAGAPALAAPSGALRELHLQAEDEVVDAEVVDRIIEGRAAAVEVEPPRPVAEREDEAGPEAADEGAAEERPEPEAVDEPPAGGGDAEDPAADETPAADDMVTAFTKPVEKRTSPAARPQDGTARPPAAKPRSSRRVGGLGRGLELDLDALDIEPVIPDLGPPRAEPKAGAGRDGAPESKRSRNRRGGRRSRNGKSR